MQYEAELPRAAGLLLILSALVFIVMPSNFLMLLILAITLVLGLTLVTDNTGEFRRVSGLPVENWLRDDAL